MMIKKWLRRVSFTLAGTMMATAMLAGCGQQETANESKPEENKVEDMQTSESSVVPEGKTDDEVDISEPYTIDVYFSTWGLPTDDVEDVAEAMSEITREKINADVVLHDIAIGQWDQQIPLEFSAGSKIDYIVASANMTPNYSSMVSSGQLLPLSDLVEKHGQGLKEVLGDFMYAAQIQGDFYAVPVNKERGLSYGGFVFNKAIVEELGLMDQVKAIKSYKDLEPIFEVVKAEKPEVICLSLPDGHAYYSKQPFVDYYGTIIGGVMPIDTTDYQLVDMWTYEPWLEAVRWTHEMYKMGYVSEEVITHSDQSFKAGIGFCMPYALREGIEPELTASHGFDVMMVEVADPYCQADQAQGVMGGIGTTSENPERAMMFMNLLYTDADLLNTFIYGVEGQHWEKSSTATDSLGNEITFIKYPEGVDSMNTGWGNQGWAYGNQFINYMMEGRDVDNWANYLKSNEKIRISSTFGFSFDQEPVSSEISACNSIILKYSQLEYGALDPDEVVPQMMEELKAAGYDKVKEEKQRQIDQWVAENK